jgi:hypothetical protein
MQKKKSTKKYKKTRKGFRRRRATVGARIPENKHFDVNLSQNCTSSGTLNLVSAITQGVDDTQRLGNTLYLKTLFLTTKLVLSSNSTHDEIRLIVLIDRQGYNTPAIFDIVEPALMGTSLSTISQYNHYYMSRFKILYDKTLKLSSGFSENLIWRRTIPLRVASHYIGATTTFKNQIYVLHFSGQSNILAYPNISIGTRIIYTDS